MIESDATKISKRNQVKPKSIALLLEVAHIYANLELSDYNL